MAHNLKLYRPDQVRALDQKATAQLPVTGFDLMEKAGAFVFDCIQAQWPEARSISICCGGGNNGGDGWVVARLAVQSGWDVEVVWLSDPSDLQNEAQLAHRAWLEVAHDAVSRPFDASVAFRGEIVVDALLGTGFRAPLSAPLRACIEAMNETTLPIVSIDVPSGLCASTGTPAEEGGCVSADLTIGFVGRKCGLYTGQARCFRGRMVFSDLGIEPFIFDEVPAQALLLQSDMLQTALPIRSPVAHKGNNGQVLIVGGEYGMAGAPVLAGLSALRSGSGLVRLAGREEMVQAAIANQPALMAHDLKSADDMQALMSHSDVVAIGPGLGQSDWAQDLLEQACGFNGPLVVDADGLNLLAKRSVRRSGLILTPHPGEAARLLDTTVTEVESDRFAAASALTEKYDAVVVLKGAGTIISGVDGAVSVCDQGSSAMASAGMGDALTGVITSLWAQGMRPYEAACLGVLVHALAGDQAASTRRQIVATDLIDQLPRVMLVKH